MDILDLQYQNIQMSLDFSGDGVEYFDYNLTLKDANVETTYTLTPGEIQDLIHGTEQFLKQLKEKFTC